MGNAVQEMQLSSERMRDEIATLTRQSESLETTVGERTDHLAQDLDGFAQDMRGQMDRRKEHLKKMVNDVMQIGESLQGLLGDFGHQKKSTGDIQGKLQTDLDVLGQQAQALHKREDSGAQRQGYAGAEPTASPLALAASPSMGAHANTASNLQNLQQALPTMPGTTAIHYGQRPITPVHQRPQAANLSPLHQRPSIQAPGVMTNQQMLHRGGTGSALSIAHSGLPAGFVMPAGGMHYG